MTDNLSGQKTIALIEDEEILANLLVQKLEKAGHKVELAIDGEAGLALIQDKKPDLVLLDIMLPKLNGFQILEQLTAEKLLPALPVIIISNSGQPVEIDRALKMGVRDYLIKANFNPDEVMTKVARVLSSQQEVAANSKQVPPSETSEQPQKNILIVEDDVFMAGLLERKFSQNNYKILKAASATQAKEALAKNTVDLVLLDVVLPGMDGFTFLRELKKDRQFASIPVIITSNLGQQEEIERGISAGAADYIVKAHTSPREIVEKVQQILR